MIYDTGNNLILQVGFFVTNLDFQDHTSINHHRHHVAHKLQQNEGQDV